MDYLIQSSEPHYKMGISSPMLFPGELMLSDIIWLTPKKGFKAIWRVRKKNKTKNNNMHASSSLWKLIFPSMVSCLFGFSLQEFSWIVWFSWSTTNTVVRSETRFHGIPSVSDSGVELVMRGAHRALGRGNQVVVFSRKSRGQMQHLRGHVSKLPVPPPPRGDRKWRLRRLPSSVFSVPCALLISPDGTCPQSSALRYSSPLTSVESPVPVLNSLLLRCVWGCVSHAVVSDSSRPMDCSPPSFSVHGILQARVLEWGPFPPPGDLPHPGIEPRSPALQADSLLSQPYNAMEILLSWPDLS